MNISYRYVQALLRLCARPIAMLTCALLLPAAMTAAVKDLPVKRINGTLYHYYEVPAGESLYTLLYKLDVNKETMLRHNPSVADGVCQGMTLYFPVEGEPQQRENATPIQQASDGSGTVRHYVERGETIFGISRKYGLTTEQVIAQNPFLADGLKAGQTLTLTIAAPNETQQPVVTVTTASPETKPATSGEAAGEATSESPMRGHIVKKKETFYSIAVANGLSVAALEAANPGVTTLKEGQLLNIPVPAREDDGVAVTDDVPVQGGAVQEGMGADASRASLPSAPTAVDVAVMLPFMLNEETLGKGAARYTEFYKGLLLAADSLRAFGTPIRITAYDTEGTMAKVTEAMGSSGFANHNVIIAPDNAPQLAVLAEYGKNNNVLVLNTFQVRDETHLENPMVFQGNLPSALMYGKAVDALVQRFERSTPVFVSFKGERGDKADFVGALRKALADRGIKSTDIEADGTLTAADLQALLADGNYWFIPSSSRQGDLNKIMPALLQWRDDAITPLVRLMGYPEWTTFRGETLENMHNLNTTVYSRFYTDEDSSRTRDIDNRYRRWYGEKMENAIPRQGLLGFDTGMFLIPYVSGKRMAQGGYDGVQHGYFPVKASAQEDSGLYNDTLYFINFKPGGLTTRTRL